MEQRSLPHCPSDPISVASIAWGGRGDAVGGVGEAVGGGERGGDGGERGGDGGAGEDGDQRCPSHSHRRRSRRRLESLDLPLVPSMDWGLGATSPPIGGDAGRPLGWREGAGRWWGQPLVTHGKYRDTSPVENSQRGCPRPSEDSDPVLVKASVIVSAIANRACT
uniref:Uncharacterized protein LOC116938048 isoform X2 n=1 Tax=Petromyzon marinus TaxID=7757 RepID=A0AAJ7WKI1_PETMA|nr:uncharacterized protein LOC116938048 isoform X2 [Petromyzon marinus]